MPGLAWMRSASISMSTSKLPISSAKAERLSALETAEFFKQRARRANIDTFDRIMNRAGGEPPCTGDELPNGYKRRNYKTAN